MKYEPNSADLSVNNQTGAENLSGFLSWFDRKCSEVLHRTPNGRPRFDPAEIRAEVARYRAAGRITIIPPPARAHYRSPGSGRKRLPETVAALAWLTKKCGPAVPVLPPGLTRQAAALFGVKELSLRNAYHKQRHAHHPTAA